MSFKTDKPSLSRLLTGERTAIAEPLVWMGPDGGPPPPVLPASPSFPAVPLKEEKKPDVENEEHLRVMLEQQTRIHDLEHQVEARPRQAYQQGFNEGQAAGVKQANARVDPVLAKLAHSIQELAAARKRHLVESEEDAVKLAMAVARRILHRELSVDPDSILGVVKAAFERVDARDIHRVRMNPEDVPALQRHLVALNVPPRVEITPDPALERGGVIVETIRGSLDASVSTQLIEIERGLVDMVRRNS